MLYSLTCSALCLVIGIGMIKAAFNEINGIDESEEKSEESEK